MPAPIIAAYDPASEDRAPVELALAAAEQSGSPATAVAVYPWEPSEGLLNPYPDDGATKVTVTDAMRRLHEDLGVETRILTDVSVPHALHVLAGDERAGLIVVGSTMRDLLGRVMTGSTAERLLHGAPCPIALAPQGYQRTRIGAIAVGFVDSPEGHAALNAAHALAAHFGASLRVIAALHPSGGLDAAMASGMKPQRSVMLEGRHRSAAQDALDFALRALAPGVEIESELHVDDPADLLLRISEHVDLLVCGSRGYGPLRSVLLGGVSRRLVDGAHCSVLVLPRGVEAPLEDLLADGAAVVR